MKKTVALLMILAVILSLTSCIPNKEEYEGMPEGVEVLEYCMPGGYNVGEGIEQAREIDENADERERKFGLYKIDNRSEMKKYLNSVESDKEKRDFDDTHYYKLLMELDLAFYLENSIFIIPTYINVSSHFYDLARVYRDGLTFFFDVGDMYTGGAGMETAIRWDLIIKVPKALFFGCVKFKTFYDEDFYLSEDFYELVDASEKLSFTLKDDDTYSITATGKYWRWYRNLNIPESYNGKPVTELEDYCFSSCTHLERLIIPNGITRIGKYAFFYCGIIEELYIPESLTDIDPEAFFDSGGFVSIDVSESNPSYCSIDGSLYTKDGKTLIRHATSKTDGELTLPPEVEIIGCKAFDKNRGIKTLFLHEGVRSIESGAFAYTGIETIYIPKTIEKIEDKAFMFSFDMEYVVYAGTVEEWNSIDIAKGVFEGVPATAVQCSDGTIYLK